MKEYTVQEVAKLLGVSRVTIFRKIKAGKIKHRVEKKGAKPRYIVMESLEDVAKQLTKKVSPSLLNANKTKAKVVSKADAKIPEPKVDTNNSAPESITTKSTDTSTKVFIQNDKLNEMMDCLEKLLIMQTETNGLFNKQNQEIELLQKKMDGVQRELKFCSKKLVEVENNQERILHKQGEITNHAHFSVGYNQEESETSWY